MPGRGMLAGPLRYVHEDAPVLLLQTVTDWDGGPLGATDLVRLGGVQYTAGVPIFYFYAGFYVLTDWTSRSRTSRRTSRGFRRDDVADSFHGHD